MRGSNQGGSLAGFIVVGVFLALILVGGLYGLNRYNAEQHSKQVAADNKKEEVSSKNNSQQDEQSKLKTNESNSSNPNSTSSDDSHAKNQVNTSTGTQQAVSNQSNTQLPQTGPVDTLAHILAVGLLSFATVYYVQSRHHLKRLLP